MSDSLTISSQKAFAEAANQPCPRDSYKYQRVNGVDAVSDFFAYPVVFANKSADAGSFFWSRAFYFAQIISSIIGMLGVVFAGVVYSAQNLSKKSGKSSDSCLPRILPNVWMQTKLLVGSVFGLITPLAINRKLRGVEKQMQREVLPSPESQTSRPQESFIDTAISLVLDCCRFAQWTRQS